MSRVLITGATGYIGSKLASHLTGLGREVHAVVRNDSGPEKLARVSKAVRLHTYDGNTESIAEIVRAAKPEATFHLAAKAVRDHRAEDILPQIESNIILGTQLADALMRHAPGCPMVFTASYSQFPNSATYEPQNLYAATKQAFCDVLKYFADAGLSAITLVLLDTYGPGDWRGRIVDLIARAVLSGKPLDASPGGQKLDLTYIDDVVAALLRGAEVASSDAGHGKTYWANTGGQLTVRELAAQIEKVAGRKGDIRWGAIPYRTNEAMAPWVGPRLPGWAPKVSLPEGLRAVLASHGQTGS